MASISLDQVTKVYANGFTAVRDLSLDVADGEFMVLVGPSGCGKTTALRMAAGLEEITSGTIRIGERVVNDVSPRNRDVAMVFQNYALYPHMTVADNIGYALKMRKLPKSEIRARVRGAAEILGISDWLDRKPGQLSGGQRQRVAIARALVGRPAIVLADEPTGNLDQATGQGILDLFQELYGLGVTIVVITHDQAVAARMGRRIEMLDGHIFDDSVQQASASPELPSGARLHSEDRGP
jgi:multiple sugar transport system ATP-binding protein